MSRFTREELSKRVNDLEIDEDIKLSLIEDITDSMDDGSALSELQSKYDAKEKEYNDLREKYKSRFFSSDDVVKEEKQETNEEFQEVEVIDIKEI